MPTSWKKRSYVIFGILAIVYSAVGILPDRHASNEQGKLQQNVSSLNASFEKSEAARRSEREAAENARQSDRDAFLAQFNDLNRQVATVRTSVQTEGLRKQLDETQRSLHRTQQALEKREVKLDFVINGQVNPSELSVALTPSPGFPKGQFVLAFALVNNADEDAGSGLAEISIVCTDCGYRFVGVDPWPHWDSSKRGVSREFLGIHKHSATNLGRLMIFSDLPSSSKQVRIEFRYQCLHCVPEEWHFAMLNLVS